MDHPHFPAFPRKGLRPPGTGCGRLFPLSIVTLEVCPSPSRVSPTAAVPGALRPPPAQGRYKEGDMLPSVYPGQDGSDGRLPSWGNRSTLPSVLPGTIHYWVQRTAKAGGKFSALGSLGGTAAQCAASHSSLSGDCLPLAAVALSSPGLAPASLAAPPQALWLGLDPVGRRRQVPPGAPSLPAPPHYVSHTRPPNYSDLQSRPLHQAPRGCFSLCHGSQPLHAPDSILTSFWPNSVFSNLKRGPTTGLRFGTVG